MGDDSLVGILFFAIVAVFLAHRLWQVLGRRDDQAPRPPGARPDQPRTDPFAPRNQQNAVPARDFPGLAVQQSPAINPGDPVSLDASLRLIRNADPRFDEKQFITGAKAAFQTIVTAFAVGNREALRPLLSDDVYSAFTAAIAVREAEGQTLQTTIVKVSAELESASFGDNIARVTVAFRSGQTMLLRAGDGTLIDGMPGRVEDVVDVWTFARDVRSADPNWTLSETRQAGS